MITEVEAPRGGRRGGLAGPDPDQGGEEASQSEARMLAGLRSDMRAVVLP